jgi:two-component system, LytTR family, sensor kinase
MNNSKEWSKFDTEPAPGGAGVSGTYLMKTSLAGSRRIKYLLHILAWVILLGLPLYFIKRWHVDEDFIWLYYINTILNGIIFYSNYLVLIPRYFFSGERYKYYISVAVLLACFYLVSDVSNKMVFRYFPSRYQTERTLQTEQANHQPGPPPDLGIKRPPFRQMHLFNYTFNAVFLIFFSLGLKVLERQNKFEETRKELEKEKLNSELAFLKNQISPHFFFNTLNNIYSLIDINAEDSQKAVLKLSKMMRYLLYESETGTSQLGREIEFLNNYIDLMKLRMSDKVALTVSFPEKNEDINIPPLLFIPFIENAFKHGISYRGKSFIDISMTTTKECISFTCSNSIGQPSEENKSNSSGIGLENVRKRLNLLFPDKHELNIIRSDNKFDVSLNIYFS